MADWVHAVERAYVAAATGGTLPAGRSSDVVRARAAIGAVASRYLAVGTPRTLGIVATDLAFEVGVAAVEAHRTWFAPRELRCAGSLELAAAIGASVASIEQALASDIVCVHAPIALHAGQLRRGTHVNVLTSGCVIDDDLRRIATVFEEDPHLGELAAGLIDGRQLDEITIFVIANAAVAVRALSS